LTNLINNPAEDSFLSWSPDGKLIAFASTRDGKSHIFVMNNDGSSLTQLTSGAIEDWAPVWSPDGNYIAFASNRAGKSDIFKMRADGTEPVNLTNTPEASEWALAWSPK